ncbi:MAG: hypothetical protein K1000chlam2_00116 [Chlamydiae bacterium]|nr:hypothetical protein [Chlamydiota bacterium]
MTTAITVPATKIYEVEFSIRDHKFQGQKEIIAEIFEKNTIGAPSRTSVGLAMNITFYPPNKVRSVGLVPMFLHDAEKILQEIKDPQRTFWIEQEHVYII